MQVERRGMMVTLRRQLAVNAAAHTPKLLSALSIPRLWVLGGLKIVVVGGRLAQGWQHQTDVYKGGGGRGRRTAAWMRWLGGRLIVTRSLPSRMSYVEPLLPAKQAQVLMSQL